MKRVTNPPSYPTAPICSYPELTGTVPTVELATALQWNSDKHSDRWFHRPLDFIRRLTGRKRNALQTDLDFVTRTLTGNRVQHCVWSYLNQSEDYHHRHEDIDIDAPETYIAAKV